MDIDTKLEKRNKRLSEIDASLDRDFRKLLRVVIRMSKLRAERKRLLKPRSLNDNEKPLKIESQAWHKIRELHLSDEIPDFLKREGA